VRPRAASTQRLRIAAHRRRGCTRVVLLDGAGLRARLDRFLTAIWMARRGLVTDISEVAEKKYIPRPQAARVSNAARKNFEALPALSTRLRRTLDVGFGKTAPIFSLKPSRRPRARHRDVDE